MQPRTALQSVVMIPRILIAVVSLVAAVCAQTVTIAEKLGYPKDARLLVIQSDLAMMHSTNRAAFEALEKGWITSATIIVPCPWFAEAAGFARAHPNGDYGLHLALNSEWDTYRWGPVSARAAVPTLLDKDGYFPPLTEDVVKHAELDDIERELRAQIEKARTAGINLTHLDAHMETLWATAELIARIREAAGRETGRWFQWLRVAPSNRR